VTVISRVLTIPVFWRLS